MNKSLFIASRKGRIYRYDIASGELSVAFQDTGAPEIMMGLEKRSGCIYAGGKSKILRLRVVGKALVADRQFVTPIMPTGFHQMFIHDNHLYIAVTCRNEVWKFNLSLNLVERYVIDPPNKDSPHNFTGNYNHLNSIFWYEGRFYVCLNWFTQVRYGCSGIVVLDRDMKELHRFRYGWEAHNCVVLDDEFYALCATSKSSAANIKHPHKSGLMVEGRLVFEHSSELYFCKDFSIDDEFIYMVGGGTAKRSDRDFSDGVIFILDRKFKHIATRTFSKSGEFLGCLLDQKDLTKGSGNE